MDEKLYTVNELTKILNLHAKTIIKFIHEGKIKGQKIGRSWMVSETNLKQYVHGNSVVKSDKQSQDTDSQINKRISVSAVIEIIEQNSEEATRISNSIMAMLNCYNEDSIKTRFDFFYYPETEKAKYVVYGSPKNVTEIISTFEMLIRR